MKDFMKNQLLKLVQTPAISGYEWYLGIADVIQTMANKKCQRIGDNLIITIGNGRKKIFISAHMDEVGFFISAIEKDYVRIMPIGSIAVSRCEGKRLMFRIGNNYAFTEKIKATSSFSTLKVYGLKNPEIGCVGTFEKKHTITADIITGPSLDNKVGCLALIQTLQSCTSAPKDTMYIFCFASREEVSLNGVMQAVKTFDPDICIDIDSAYALPLSLRKKRNWQIPTIGKGPAIQLIGNNFIIRSDNRFFIEKITRENNIPFQYEIPDEDNGGTNASTLISNGYDTMQINIPVANQHSADSKASFVDIENTTALLSKILIAI